MPPYRYDDICDLCPPGKRKNYSEPDRVQHWRKHHPERFTLMLAMLRDQKEGFGWRPMANHQRLPVRGVMPPVRSSWACRRQVGCRVSPPAEGLRAVHRGGLLRTLRRHHPARLWVARTACL